jgi:peptidoglycan/LPS O-acetylase OafA/YrhL
MLEGITILASALFSGGEIGNTFNELANAGFFTYILPFLLLFSIVFALLTQTGIFREAKGINAIIAVSVALMALQFNLVSTFFSEIFPRVGVGLSIVLIIMIFTGMFFNTKSKTLMWAMLAIGALIVVVILVQTSGALGWSSGIWWYENWKTIAFLVGFVAVLAIIVGAGQPSDKEFETPFMRALVGERR